MFIPFLELEVSDQIQIIAIVATTAISLISLFIAIATLKQNSKMIEESTRPYVAVYGMVTNFQSPSYKIVVKNFGQSAALIKGFESDYDLLNCAFGGDSKRPFEHLPNTFIAPNQSFICAIDYLKTVKDNVENINFKIVYQAGKKIYSESITLNLTVNRNLINPRASTDGKELKIISYALQDLVEKNL